MKRENLFVSRAACWFSALGILAGIHTVHAQGTAFTYQGRLNDGANPANGNFDLKFTIFGASSGGSAVAGPVSVAPVGVSNGLFAVSLDFGGGVFTGPVRWLEIGVRTNGTMAAYTTLGQRQQLTPAPYAMFAGSASNVASGSVVQSLNSLKDNVTLAAGSNVTITPSGNTLTIASAGAGGSGIWSVNANNAYYNAGNVGIGTNNPQTTLHIVSPQHALTMTAFGPDVTFQDTAHSNARGVIQSVNGEMNLFTESYMSGANPFALFTLKNNGNVGIGNPQPQATLDVVSPQHALAMTAYGPDVTFYDTGHGYARSAFQSVNGGMNIFTESYLSGVNPFAYLSLNNSGNVGIGSATPASKLDVIAQDALGLIGYQPFLTLKDSNAGYARSRIQGVNGILSFQTEAYINGSSPAGHAEFDGTGNLSIASLTIRGGADVAEPFVMKDAEVKKGSVVVIDEKHPGQLKLSTRAYDTHVAGIVSGANGINPGIALHQEGALEGGQNVALSGRVYVQADASGGAIEPGDLLTTSDTPGCAMKVTDHAKAQGAILGKAMSALKGGKGMVLVLVTLQ